MTNLNTEHQISGLNSFTCTENKALFAEKRKRYQKYAALNYCTELMTYFDFFSFDTFNILKNSKYLAKSLNSKIVTNHHILLSFLENNGELRTLLEDFGIAKADLITPLETLRKNYLFSFIGQLFLKLKLFFSKDNQHNLNAVTLSEETRELLEKSVENAVFYFKTPIITSEILFLTLAEQKNTSVSEHLQKLSSKKLFWYSSRYKLLKRIHFIESYIRNNVPKNQHYFAYLLQAQIPEKHFDHLLKNDTLQLGVLFFRTKLFSKIKTFSLSSLIEKEIYNSIKFSDQRQYSS